jgi:hypothetical protein
MVRQGQTVKVPGARYFIFVGLEDSQDVLNAFPEPESNGAAVFTAIRRAIVRPDSGLT